LEIHDTFSEIVIGNSKIALLHGDDAAFLKDIVENGNFDLVVFGHTHKPNIYRKGVTLVVNPGEVCGYITGKSTILDLKKVYRINGSVKK